MTKEFRLIRRTEVERICGLSRSAIYRLMREGRFPEPIQIGPRAVRWKSTEIDAFLASRPRATGEASRVSA